MSATVLLLFVVGYFGVLLAVAARLLGGRRLGLELLVLNGALTWAGLWLMSAPATALQPARGLTRSTAEGQVDVR